MERSRQTHRQKIEKMKQNHESLMKEIDHTVKLECEQVEKGADLGKCFGVIKLLLLF